MHTEATQVSQLHHAVSAKLHTATFRRINSPAVHSRKCMSVSPVRAIIHDVFDGDKAIVIEAHTVTLLRSCRKNTPVPVSGSIIFTAG